MTLVVLQNPHPLVRIANHPQLILQMVIVFYALLILILNVVLVN